MTKAGRNLSLTSTLTRLLRAEHALSIDGLSLRMQCDGSGSVARFNDSYVFKFDRLPELDAWLKSPRVVEYDEEGNAVFDDASIWETPAVTR